MKYRYIASCVFTRDYPELSLRIHVALIPIVRMLVMVNHAHIHFFFTYRALSVFLLAMMLLVINAVDWKKVGHSVKQFLPTK